MRPAQIYAPVTTMEQVHIFIPIPTAFHISVPGTGLGDGREGRSLGHTGLVPGGTVWGGGKKAMNQGKLEGFQTPKTGR